MATRSVHFIVLPFPAQGHISPILYLSKILAQKGGVVTVANIQPVHRQLQQKWQSAGFDIQLVGIPFPLDAPFGIDGIWYSRIYEFIGALSHMRSSFEDLVQHIICQDNSSTKFVLIADYFVEWHREVAAKFNMVAVTYWPGNAYWFSVHYHLPAVQSKQDIPVRDPDRVIDYISGVPPLKLKDFPAYVQLGSKEYRGSFMSYPLEDKWILVNSTHELQPSTFQVLQELLGRKVIPIGPLFNNTSTFCSSLRNEEECAKWLDCRDQRSVLYISLGSIATLTCTEFQAFVEGLEKSRVPFLWVIRTELIPAKSLDLVQDFVKRTRSTQRGLILGWASQLQVLFHEAVGGFLSHCGWNSIFESISAGVPILGCPFISEQRLNCKLVVEGWRIGTRLSIEDGNAAEVITEFMLNSNLLGERVAELKKLVETATSADGSSTNNLAYFFEEMCSL